MKYLNPDIFMQQAADYPVIDVRSPAEYTKGHITHAINIPLFTDDERAIIGTIYKNEGQQGAIQRGLELVSPKLENFKKSVAEIASKGVVLVHCWRGGMRSEKMALLFEQAGLKSYVLKGGFKAYRKKLRDDFDKLQNLIVLEGPTGTGKTEILYQMRRLGAQVIDLEMLANHKGSTFGWIGLPSQPTTSQFQNDVHSALLALDPNRPVWVEGESLKIGKVTLPETLWSKMNESKIVYIEQPFETRIKRIVAEYGKHTKDALIRSVKKIEQRLGNENLNNVIKQIEEDKLEDTVSTLLYYYDKSYYYSLKKYRKQEPVKIQLRSIDPALCAKQILDTTEHLLRK